LGISSPRNSNNNNEMDKVYLDHRVQMMQKLGVVQEEEEEEEEIIVMIIRVILVKRLRN
jgi:ribosome assembly protein YihI (activator of Der GTPase)